MSVSLSEEEADIAFLPAAVLPVLAWGLRLGVRGQGSGAG